MGTRIFAAFLNLESDPLSLPKLLLQISQKAALTHPDGQKTPSEVKSEIPFSEKQGFPPCYSFNTKSENFTQSANFFHHLNTWTEYLFIFNQPSL